MRKPTKRAQSNERSARRRAAFGFFFFFFFFFLVRHKTRCPSFPFLRPCSQSYHTLLGLRSRAILTTLKFHFFSLSLFLKVPPKGGTCCPGGEARKMDNYEMLNARFQAIAFSLCIYKVADRCRGVASRLLESNERASPVPKDERMRPKPKKNLSIDPHDFFPSATGGSRFPSFPLAGEGGWRSEVVQCPRWQG
ncbi:hypothetical protein DFJ73DRAFT_338788 [Zopfochytrium polystomum]|nr:hypothetical protein DFJ73DRAFT_338788 [Zopfochytrium polystomum]